MANNLFIKERINYHFRRNATLYTFTILALVVGIVLGLYLTFTDFNYTSLLTSSDKTMFDYITGTASYVDIFYSRLLSILGCLFIIFIFNLSVYTSFLGYIFIGYQTTLFVLSCSAIISLYGFTGLLNVLLFILPINVANIFVMVISNVLSTRRAVDQKEYRLNFFESFKEDKYIYAFLICLLFALVICLIHSFVLPLIIKSFVVINY